MRYGRFAVIIFTALSDFSKLSPYVLLPLLLLVRRVSARAMVGLVAAIVVTIGLLGPMSR
jgi:hypothetical protein